MLASLVDERKILLGLCAAAERMLCEADCRTVPIEVGMQNGVMATGLAIGVLHSHVAALPPNVFGAWMNFPVRSSPTGGSVSRSPQRRARFGRHKKGER